MGRVKMESFFPDGRAIPFQLQSTSSIGRGATADVFSVIVGDKKYAAKIYKPNADFDRAKIEYMCEMGSPSHDSLVTFAWPVALVRDEGSVVGYLMPIFEKSDYYQLNYYFDSILFEKLSDKSITSLSNRVEVAKSLCSAMAIIHDRSIFFIDLKPQNVLVNFRTNGVVILDCDGFSIRTRDGRIFPAGHVSTDYIAPEVTREHLHPNVLAAPQDNYALAVVLFQMFNFAQHPFQGTPVSETIKPFTNDELAAEGLYPHSLAPSTKILPRRGSTHTFLPSDMRLLFDRSFTGRKEVRVQPREWNFYFSSLIAEKRLQRCRKFPEAVNHINFKDFGCAECAREEFRVQLGARKNGGAKASLPLKPMPSKLVATQNPSVTLVPKEGSPVLKWLGIILALVAFFYVSIMNGDKQKPLRATTSPAVSSTNLKQSEISAAPKNPTNMSKVDLLKVVDVASSQFTPYKNSSTGTFTIVLPVGTSISNIKNPALYIALKYIAFNDCFPTPKEIASAQMALSELGYRVGIIDGIRGPATVRGLTSFQKSRGLSESGELDMETALSLGVYVAGYDLKRFKYHSRGSVFDSSAGPIIRFLDVKNDVNGFCYFVARE